MDEEEEEEEEEDQGKVNRDQERLGKRLHRFSMVTENLSFLCHYQVPVERFQCSTVTNQLSVAYLNVRVWRGPSFVHSLFLLWFSGLDRKLSWVSLITLTCFRQSPLVFFIAVKDQSFTVAHRC